jgi:amino acid permease
MMIYFIVFSDTTGQLVGSFNDHALGEIWYSSRYFYVLLLGAALAPVILKKDLAELEWLSIVLFVSIGLFIVVNFWELVIDPKFVPVNTSTKEYFEPKITIKFISSLSIILVAYSYQQNVFPVFSSLQVKTN